MARNGSGVYSLPAGSIVSTGETILPAQHNDPLNDLASDANAARPVAAGGTGATTAAAALVNLGVTATAAELNKLAGVTASTAELNILDGVTSTAAELNILDGVTATAAELNKLDGVTATTAELNYTDGVTSNIQAQLNAKASLAGATYTGAVEVASTTAAFIVNDTNGVRGGSIAARVVFEASGVIEGYVGFSTGNGVMALRNDSNRILIQSNESDDGTGRIDLRTSAQTRMFIDDDGVSFLSGVDFGQTWQDVSGSRSAGTSYQNTTGKPIHVNIVGISASGVRDVQVSSNNSSWVTVGTVTGLDGVNVSFPVPDDWYYRLASGGGIVAWAELR